MASSSPRCELRQLAEFVYPGGIKAPMPSLTSSTSIQSWPTIAPGCWRCLRKAARSGGSGPSTSSQLPRTGRRPARSIPSSPDPSKDECINCGGRFGLALCAQAEREVVITLPAHGALAAAAAAHCG
jgi:hypothetical protein